MNRTTFQVNLNFGPRDISAACVQRPKEVHTLYPVVHAPNLPKLLKRIKAKCNLTLEEIALEFQPESFIDTTTPIQCRGQVKHQVKE